MIGNKIMEKILACFGREEKGKTPTQDEGPRSTTRQRVGDFTTSDSTSTSSSQVAGGISLRMAPGTAQAGGKPLHVAAGSVGQLVVSEPAPGILLVRLNRPESLNCINSEGHAELEKIWRRLDEDPSLKVGIITGTGRAFCAGADLKEWNSANQSNSQRPMPPSGFGALSRRTGLKPVIAAVNGICFGGGCEIIVNCDLVLASPSATFALPEVKRGVVAIAGALPRIVRTIGRPRAMEMALTGRTVSAKEAAGWGLINGVVQGDVVAEAVKMGQMIAENSPDAVIVSREGVKLGWEGIGAEEGSRLLIDQWYPRLLRGENIKEGVKAFVEKRKPVWKEAKL
ncbi:3-hydroxypropionyl-coenzyme A dehydratase [Sphaceloma murrayae]|uniref:3-hydroxypropionyl-coenzyme A dehydratase n=1 Tax=Sphaceloma murrayae TaxID=2082308 RepID=A0A2K1QS74_9PEZI|nr:3-hydroxypropionyl-coenzyme A dehydratase [Sphaceloma murrayae]